MIPDEVRAEIVPILAAPGDDGPQVTLPCGLAVKFSQYGVGVTWEDFRAWDVPRYPHKVREVAEAAALNAISYVQWPEVEPGVYENDDNCWPEMVLAPDTFIEHNSVEGRPVVYIVSARKAILTGADSVAGRARIRAALRGGLAESAMGLNWDRKTWSPFYVHDAIGFDLRRVTVTGKATGEARYRLGENYGHVILEVSPYTGPHEFLLVWGVGEDVIPSEFREAVWRGIQGFATDYFRETGPLVGVRVAVVGGSYHEVDSKSRSYEVAATMAFKNAVMQMALAGVPERRQEMDAGEG